VKAGPVFLGLVLGAAAWALASPMARADPSPPPPATHLNAYSAYERQSIDDALAFLHATEDKAPEGKIVEGIDILTLEVFEKRDPIPGFVNIFHATTRHYVIEREILLRRGERYRQVLIDDSIRNLRALPQLSLVLTLTTEGSEPSRVRLVVITKDVWSLRPNWDLELTSGGLQSLSAQPAETNLAGTHQIVSGNFILQPDSLTLGAAYSNPRLAGTHVVVQPSANIILNVPTDKPEGSYGGLIIGQPLYSPLTGWAWDAEAGWADYIGRRYSNAALVPYNDPLTNKSVPFAYRVSQYNTQYTLTRSFGWTTKHDLTFGVSVTKNDYPSTPQQLATALPPCVSVPGPHGSILACAPYDVRALEDFISTSIPVSDNRVGPFFQYHTYSKTYARLLDIDTLGLQEDFRLGHDVYLNVYPVFHALGSSRDFVGFDGAAQYTVQLGDGLARVAVESITEVQTSGECASHVGQIAPSGPVCDASIEPALHLSSPTAFIGRFVFDAHLLYRFSNSLTQEEQLGGDTRLRGYPAEYFAGYNVLDSNLEFRTRSVDIWTAQVGVVGFYDVGDAFNTWATSKSGPLCQTGAAEGNFCPVQSLGAGLRVLFPQLDRIAFRGDIGFPLGVGRTFPGVTPFSFFITLGQAFTAPVVAPGAGTGSTVVLPGLSGSPTTALPPPP
jgi:hypothetical protein